MVKNPQFRMAIATVGLFSMFLFFTATSDACTTRQVDTAAHANSGEADQSLVAQAEIPLDFSVAAQETLQKYRKAAVRWSQPSKQPYLPWVNKHVNSIVTLGAHRNPEEIKLVITTFSNDDRPISEPLIPYRTFSSSNALRKDGTGSHRTCYAGGSKGASGGKALTKQEMEKVDQLISKLPSDGGVLPPPNRRVLIEVPGTEPQSWVYNLAKLPPQACELFQLCTHVAAYVPGFQSHTSIQIPEFERLGPFALTPQNEIIFAGTNDRIRWLDGETFKQVAESDVRTGTSNPCFVALSTDGLHAFLSTPSLVRVDLKTRKSVGYREAYIPSFTSDGKHVLLQTRDTHPALVLSTDNWEVVDRPEEIPKNWDSFVAAKTKPRTVASKRDGSAVLWDTQKQAPVKTLDTPKVHTVTVVKFSPDESRFAMQRYGGPNGIHHGTSRTIDIYDTNTGEKLITVTPFETNRDPLIHCDGLWWTPDGKYLVAVFDHHSRHTICIFNTQTGRHCGVLTDPPGPGGMRGFLGIGFQKDSQQFVACDNVGKLWFWHLPDVLEMVQQFEDSLK